MPLDEKGVILANIHQQKDHHVKTLFRVLVVVGRSKNCICLEQKT